MPTIDALLRAVLQHDMEALLLRPGSQPALRKSGQEHGVTKNVLDRDSINHLLSEVTPLGHVPDPGSENRLEFRYRLDDRQFHFEGVSTPEGWSVKVQAEAEVSFDGDEPAQSVLSIEPDGGPQVLLVEDDAGVDLGLGVSSTPTTPEPPAEPVFEPGPEPILEPEPPPILELGPEPILEPIAEAPEPAAAPAGAGTATDLTDLDATLTRMVQEGASDLHLTANHVPRWRLHGDLVELIQFAQLDSDALEALFVPIMPERNREQLADTSDTDFAYEIEGVARFRVNMFRDRNGIGAVLRQIPSKIPTVEELGLPDSLRKLAFLSKGLVLVTGPTGSGKSTTLAAIINLINQARNDHIITIEDPIEFVHPSKKCLVNQREVAVHTESFKKALRAALREDPDILLVGEMRDLETISIAIETAETGHLVFGTLHTTTAPSTVERVVDQFPGDRQAQVRMMLADSLQAVIAQTLLKKIGGGRIAAYEILLGNAAVSNLIREGKTFQIASAMQTGKKQGMQMLNDALFELVEKGVVDAREAYIKAVDKDSLKKRFETANIKLDLSTGPE